jgi:hypothetical protein
MKITRENYEIWFLDYMEGRLDKQGEEEVCRFLEQNQDLQEELESFSPVLVKDESIRYPGKEHLKKTPFDDAGHFENAALAELEGDLTSEEAESFRKWLDKNPAGKAFTAQLRQTRLQPDLTITFPGKEKLKKRIGVPILMTRIVAVAALLLLALLLFLPSGKTPGPSAFTITTPIPEGTKEKKAAPSMPVQETIRANAPGTAVAASISPRQKAKPDIVEVPPVSQPRTCEPIKPLAARPVTIVPDAPLYNDLVPVSVFRQVYYASGEIPLSEYLDNRLRSLKSDGPKGFISREELAIAGLRLFSRLPGKHLTGKKGNDGRLKSISFSTEAMAFSIPVNK